MILMGLIGMIITDQSMGYNQAPLIQTHLNDFLPGGICSLYHCWPGSPRAICKSSNLTIAFSFWHTKMAPQILGIQH